jgi:hypothetical protein
MVGTKEKTPQEIKDAEDYAKDLAEANKLKEEIKAKKL